ncbi:MAG: cell wall hydrolase [Chloroflexota bacterium]
MQDARDIAIRTIIGEAANESPMGQAAVAHVLLNRARDERWPSTVNEVALQPSQFSAWNKGAGGNDLPYKYGPESDLYKRVGGIYDAVMSGQIADPTGGATHYYAPAGMEALVREGSQTNLTPRWMAEENQRRGAAPTTIGGHIFTGMAQGETVVPEIPVEQPSIASELGRGLMALSQPQQPLQVAARPVAAFQPTRRDTSELYKNFFSSLG